MKFILFDIDGTLIDSGGAGTKALDLAFEEIFAVRDAFRAISMAGKTDQQILFEGLKMHGLAASNGIIPEFYKAYIRHLKKNISNGGGHVKAGVREVLDLLSERPGYITGLLTGNIEEGARIKLEHFGLERYFNTGAFGSDHEDRNRLLPIAVDKLYAQRSLRLPFSDCVVIGDTPRDIDCSRPHGAFAIAVATGPYSSRALSEAGADEVFEDLSDSGRLISLLNSMS